MAGTKTNPTQFENQSPPWSLVSLDQNFTNLDNAQATLNNASNYYTDSGTANNFAITIPGTQIFNLTAGLELDILAGNANTGASTLTLNGGSAKNIVNPSGSALSTGQIAASQVFKVIYDGTQWQLQTASASSTPIIVPVRQTVLSGPVDANGLPNFGGSTGSTSVTMAGTLIATSANGFSTSGAQDTVGSGTNLQWTGLSTNGTMYLYVTIAGGVLTPGATTLAPIYQWGGTPATTSGLGTFNIQQMQMFVGNGTTAPQTARVYVGQVTVSGGVVSVIIWYALMGRYLSPQTAIQATATPQVFNHNLGLVPLVTEMYLVNLTANAGYTPGQRTKPETSAGESMLPLTSIGSLSLATIGTGGAVFDVVSATTGAAVGITPANWNQIIVANRGW